MAEALPVAAIRWGSVGPLLLVSLAIMGSPGPATISLVAAGSVSGARRSVPYLAGIVTGTAIVLLAVAGGVTAALLAVPALGALLVWVSAAYILWLAYRIATAPPLSGATAHPDAFRFADGALLGVANPKGWIAIAAVFASGHLADTAIVDAAAKIAFLTAMIVAICTTWLLAGASVASLLRQPRRARLVNRALAVAMVGATAAALLH